MSDISDDVKAAIESNKGFAVILAGSDSDRPHIDKISTALSRYQVPHQVRVCSAHKQPVELWNIMSKYEAIQGAVAYIAVAGGTDALSGTLSFHSLRPVISCPPDAPNNSCLTNPPGSSNAYVARPDNVARFVAQMFSHLPGAPYEVILTAEADEKIGKLTKKDEEFRGFPYKPAEAK